MSLYNLFFGFFAPKSMRDETKCKVDKGDHEIVVAFNEVGEEVLIQFPKAYKGIVSV